MVRDYHINIFYSEEDGAYIADLLDQLERRMSKLRLALLQPLGRLAHDLPVRHDSTFIQVAQPFL